MNHFHAAGGMRFLIRELLGAGLLHEDVQTVWGTGLDGYLQEPKLGDDGERRLGRRPDGRAATRRCCAPVAKPFSAEGGLQAARPAISAGR